MTEDLPAHDYLGDPVATPERARSGRLRLGQVVVVQLLVTLGLSVLANLALDESLARGQGQDMWSDSYDRPLSLFLVSVALVWVLVALAQAVVGSVAVTVTVTVVVTAALAFANYQKLEYRHEPLYPSDFRFATDPTFLGSMVGTRTVLMVVAALVVVALFGAVVRLLSRRFLPRLDRRTDRRWWRVLVAGRVVVTLVCCALVFSMAQFNHAGNADRGLFNRAGAFWSEWNQEKNYSLNGFVGGFLYNTPVPAMTAPAGYSAAEMRRLVAKYSSAADRINAHRSAHALDDVNVVLVLSESFTDPTMLSGVSTRQDVIPYFRSVMGSTTSGKMLAQGIGGGTANMEFELLTGMSMHEFAPQLSTAYQSLVPHYRSFPSAVGWFNAHGHQTVAVHPFQPSMYRRDEVYRTFGFDRFVYDKLMTYHHKIDDSPVISDDSAFREVSKQIADHRKPLLVHLVTMQNHMPYTGLYDHPVRVTVPGGTGHKPLGQYLRGLTYTDSALRSFLGRVKKSPEKTIVLMYGDHLPSAYPASIYPRNGVRRIHETPFFVWSNYTHQDRPQPTTSPWDFMNLVFAEAGARIPPYYALLDELHRQVPAMDAQTMVDGQNRTTSYSRLSPRAKSLLHDYQMVQYDLSVGKRYSVDRMFYTLPAS